MKSNTDRSDAGNSIVQEVFGFVKENLSGAKRREDAANRERGTGAEAPQHIVASERQLAAGRCRKSFIWTMLSRWRFLQKERVQVIA
jgi:hypothetical protein